MLETAPSFSIYNNTETEDEINLESSKLNDDHSNGSVDFSFAKLNMGLIKEEEEEEEEEEENEESSGQLVLLESCDVHAELDRPVSPSLYLAAGLGIVGGVAGFGVDRENSQEFMTLLQDYPNHPLVLRRYALFLQNKGDVEEAEYYYLRAMQADPSDGEVLSEYAKLMWEVHHDQEKALTYFEQATQAAPADSNVLAAYARFLWEIDDDGRESLHPNDDQQQHTEEIVHSDSTPSEGIKPITNSLDGPASETSDPNECVEDIENYYIRMIEKNPSDPHLLKTYAQFLYQTKGDLQRAEENYLHAIMADPLNGEVLSQYAQLLWELYHDQDKALHYFESAIEASPENSDVLAAYARFLWIIEDDDVLDKQLDSLPQRVAAGCAGA